MSNEPPIRGRWYPWHSFREDSKWMSQILYFLSWSSTIIISTLTMLVLWPDVGIVIPDLGARGQLETSSGYTCFVGSFEQSQRVGGMSMKHSFALSPSRTRFQCHTLHYASLVSSGSCLNFVSPPSGLRLDIPALLSPLLPLFRSHLITSNLYSDRPLFPIYYPYFLPFLLVAR